MKIIFNNYNRTKIIDFKKSGENILFLWPDNWDDYDYKLTLNATLITENSEVSLPRIKILISKQRNTSEYLINRLAKGWSGEFPLNDVKYISLPISVDFYELIIGHLGKKSTEKCMNALHDAGYMKERDDSDEITELYQSTEFKISLLRDRNAKIALVQGNKIFSKSISKIDDFSFYFYLTSDESKIDFCFSDQILPNDINVLIGPNGSGKSCILKKMVNTWLSPKLNKERQLNCYYSESINIRKLIVVSYSPFESFPIDVNNDNSISDKSIYSYYGLRSKSNHRITLSRNKPKNDTSLSVLQCIKDDLKFKVIDDWSNKISTMESVLSQAIEFDCMALEITSKVSSKQLYNGLFDDVIFTYNGKRYINISNDYNSEIDIDVLSKVIVSDAGVVFFKKGSRVLLSSGQRLFSYIVINILGAIKKNSLIIIDEPELFLHPTLEIAFISMLKKLLSNYYSKAILATHSLVAVREVPRKCVHVLKKEKDNLFITPPPFETFGGDIQRISSYVFGDKSVSKPFEEWLKEKLISYGTAKELINALGSDINEEMIVKIYALEKTCGS
ncbi:ATP-binding protein [Aeromonas sp. 602826]|uniref:ATP-binding protein n=1 Tax=Aeromonas sp. 602826 TaxID=2712044 RepID=UPI003B9F439B